MTPRPIARWSLALLLLGLAPGCDLIVTGKGTREERAAKAATKAASTPATPSDAADGAPPTGEQAPKKPEKPKDPLDLAIEAQEGYVYNPIGKRDPFRSFLASGPKDDDDTPRTPLQRYDLDQYQLVGVIWGIDRPRALVQDPEHTGHVVEIGTYIGKNWGKVTQITSSGVVVTEEYQTIDGELVVNEIPMKLASTDTEEGRRP